MNVSDMVKNAFIDYPKQVGLKVEVAEDFDYEEIKSQIKHKYDSKEIVSMRFLETLIGSSIFVDEDTTSDVHLMLPDEELLVFFDKNDYRGIFKVNSPLSLKSILDNCGALDIYITNKNIDFLLIFLEEGKARVYGSITELPFYKNYR